MKTEALIGRLVICVLLLISSSASAASEQAVERNRIGADLMQQGRLDAAIVEFQKAVSLDAGYFPARVNLAYAYEKMNRIEEAIEAYREAIGVQPHDVFAHNNLGVLYDKQGQFDRAIAEFETALRFDGDSAIARKNLEVARKNKSVAEKRVNEILHAEKEAQAKPGDPRASYNVARLYAVSGNKELALHWLRRALKEGYNDSVYVKRDPAFSTLRDDREFELLFVTK